MDKFGVRCTLKGVVWVARFILKLALWRENYKVPQGNERGTNSGHAVAGFVRLHGVW